VILEAARGRGQQKTGGGGGGPFPEEGVQGIRPKCQGGGGVDTTGTTKTRKGEYGGRALQELTGRAKLAEESRDVLTDSTQPRGRTGTSGTGLSEAH